jgi:hypothetical protein
MLVALLARAIPYLEQISAPALAANEVQKRPVARDPALL